ncbi:uncharacterized protein [Haliotis asinina]|uniref:uncharacterized protein isoform X1 n=1 Tax=Haliotis asinina TaxID=109174 RepID=UPI0035321A73
MCRWIVNRCTTQTIICVALVSLLLVAMAFRTIIKDYAFSHIYDITPAKYCPPYTDIQGEIQYDPQGHASLSALLKSLPDKVKVPLKNISFDVMLKDYKKKLNDLKTAGLWKANDVKQCENEKNPGKACKESSCPQPKPTSPIESLKSVLSTMSGLNHEDLSLLMGLFPEPHSGRRIMFVTAASSDHFDESQAHIKNLHQKVFPVTKNYTFVYYDLGLLSWQRKQLKKHCRCEVRSFPLKHMPWRVKNLMCYTWKPIIVQANLPKADILVWMDASVRFSNNKVINPLLHDVDKRGIVVYPGRYSVAQHTLQITMKYMKEDICSLAPLDEHQATFIAFKNELLIREAVVKPWVACALSPTCMCTRNPYLDLSCKVGMHNYNKCHRFDQSAISIILNKLFRGHTDTFSSPNAMAPKIDLRRGHRENYFHELERNVSKSKTT